jgi:hypothetical protein
LPQLGQSLQATNSKQQQQQQQYTSFVKYLTRMMQPGTVTLRIAAKITDSSCNSSNMQHSICACSTFVTLSTNKPTGAAAKPAAVER